MFGMARQIVGSIGFAQVGRDDYRPKMRIEMEILSKAVKEKFPFLEPIASEMYYRVVGFPHDFGTYHELCIMYPNDWDLVDIDEIDHALECGNTVEEHESKAWYFWNWFNTIEDWLGDAEELLYPTCEARWNEYLEAKRKKGEHLKVERFQDDNPFRMEIVHGKNKGLKLNNEPLKNTGNG
jgi:hypothetical protein